MVLKKHSNTASRYSCKPARSSLLAQAFICFYTLYTNLPLFSWDQDGL